MIGQHKLKEQIGDLFFKGKFPRFSIFLGDKGSGRKTIIQEDIGYKWGAYQECGCDVDSVREVIDQAYRQMTPSVYVFADADNMSVAAKNALLKVTEEAPNNALFIMTLMNTDNTLNTIRSRATLFYMDAYTPQEILEYYKLKRLGNDDDIVKQYCTVPGDVNLLCSYNVGEFQQFLGTVLDNVEKVSGANSFKIGNRLNLGADEKKYDISLFFKAFRAECLSRIEKDPMKYLRAINVTNKYLGELRIAGINKQMLFDAWLLDIRKAWM